MQPFREKTSASGIVVRPTVSVLFVWNRARCPNLSSAREAAEWGGMQYPLPFARTKPEIFRSLRRGAKTAEEEKCGWPI